MNWDTRYASSNVKKRVLDQLADDFPEKNLGWIKQADWSGPVEVDPADIDQHNRHEWAASHEPDRVKARKKRIKKGKIKPIVLVKTPICWIGKVDRETGPWDTFHNQQDKKEAEDK